MTSLRFSRWSLVAIGFGCFIASDSIAESLRAVLASPSKFHRKIVTVTGIARGDAGRLMLFARVSDALNLSSKKYADVKASDPYQRKPVVDLRRVKVVGEVNANDRGIWGNPCAIYLKKLQVLSGPVVPWDEDLAVFHNETTSHIILRFGLRSDDTEFEVLPSECLEVRATDTIVIARLMRGSTFARARIKKRPSVPLYDSINAASYYRVTKEKIEPVLPNEAKKWGWQR